MPTSRLGISGERLGYKSAPTRRDPQPEQGGPSAISACWVGIHVPSDITSALRTRPLKEILESTRLGELTVAADCGSAERSSTEASYTDSAATIFPRLAQRSQCTALRQNQSARGQLRSASMMCHNEGSTRIRIQDRRGVNLDVVSAHLSAGSLRFERPNSLSPVNPSTWSGQLHTSHRRSPG